MCNCGKRRSQYNKTATSGQSTATAQQSGHSVATAAPSGNSKSTAATAGSGNPKIKFIYTGHSSLKIIGNSSGHPYHFRYRGEILEVIASDSSSMMNIPELSRTKAG
jgi:hypothetical protein